MKCVRPCCRKEIPDGASFCPWCGKKQPEAAPQQRKKRRRPKGSGTVYQKKDEGRVRSWIARSGRGELIGSFETSAEAVLALDDYNAKHTSVARLRYTFGDVYEKWKELHYKDIGPKGRDSRAGHPRARGFLHDCGLLHLSQCRISCRRDEEVQGNKLPESSH